MRRFRFSAVSSRVLVCFALAAVLHAAGAVAAWSVYLSFLDDHLADRPPQLSGQTTIVRLAGTPVFDQPPEPQEEHCRPLETDVVVTPTETRIARRTFVAASTDVSRPSPTELALAERLTQTPPPHKLTRRNPKPAPETDVARASDSKPPLPRRRPAVDVPPPRESLPAAATQRQSVGRTADTLPAVVDNRPPLYPAQAVSARQQGTVLLRVLVEASGAAGSVELLASSGHAVLDAEAVRAVRSWHFLPATRDGQPVPYAVRLPVRFTLN